MINLKVKKVIVNNYKFTQNSFCVLCEDNYIYIINNVNDIYTIGKTNIKIKEEIDKMFMIGFSIYTLIKTNDGFSLFEYTLDGIKKEKLFDVKSNIIGYDNNAIYYLIDNSIYLYTLYNKKHNLCKAFNSKIKQMFIGFNRIFVINDKYENSVFGMTATGTVKSIIDFASVLKHDKIKDVSFGFGHTLVLTEDSTVKGCGTNNCGQLSYDDNVPSKVFISLASNIKSIMCSNNTSYIVDINGNLLFCGANINNESLLSDNVFITKWTRIVNINGLKTVTIKNGSKRIIGKGNNTVWNLNSNPYFINRLTDIII